MVISSSARRGFRPDARLSRLEAFSLGLLLCAVLWAFAPALHGGFIWDDELIYKGRLVQAADGLRRIWTSHEAVDFWPLSYSAFWLEWRLFGLRTTGYHAVNITLHLLNSWLLWRILLRLEAPRAAAWAAVVLFALHPLTTEAVAWVFQLKTLLPLTLCAASFLAFMHWHRHGRRRFYLAACGLFLAAVLAKTAVVGLPLFFTAYIYWFRSEQLRSWREELSALLPFYAVALVFGLTATLWYQHAALPVAEQIRMASWPLRLVEVGEAFWFYTGKLFWPDPLIFIYPWMHSDLRIISFVPLLALSGLIIGILCLGRSGYRGVALGAAFYVTQLAPCLGLVDIYFMRYSMVADHWQYTALPGAAAAAGVSLARPLRLHPRLTWLCLITLAAVYAGLSHRSSERFINAETLWRVTLEANPAAWAAHNNYARLREQAGDLAAAEVHYKKALELKPDYREAYYNLALLETRGRRLAAAIEHYEQALALKPDYGKALINLTAALVLAERLTEAVAQGKRAVAVEPGSDEAHTNLALALLALKHYPEAIQHYQQALALAPADASLHAQLAQAMALLGDLAAAQGEIRAALRLDPAQPLARRLQEAIIPAPVKGSGTTPPSDNALPEHGP